MSPPPNPRAASPVPQDAEVGTPALGSSVYGGRPTFALQRRDGPNGGEVTLYELLPEDQAAARRDRLERANRSLSVTLFDDVFAESAADAVEEWRWTDWVAVKVTRLSGSRLRSVLGLVRETLKKADLEESAITGTGDADVFLPEAVGVRLAIAFAGVKPIQRVDRMRAFSRGIARMSDEECYYWHAKCRSPSSPNGEKALRTLHTGHVN